MKKTSHKLTQVLMNQLTAFNLNCAVLGVQGVVVQVHHAGKSGREPHSVSNAAISMKLDHLVLLGDVVQVTVHPRMHFLFNLPKRQILHEHSS
jgi:hypothetical protein